MGERGKGKNDSPGGLKAVVFDVDGTFYQLRELQRAVKLHYLQGHWHRPLEAWCVHRAVRALQHATDTLRESPPTDVDLSQAHIELAAKTSRLPKEFVLDCWRQWMMEEPLQFLPKFRYKGVPGILAEMRERGLHLGVFSDYPAVEKLRALGVRDFFETVISAQDPSVQRFKPDPRGLQVVLERLGVAPRQAVFVGDRPGIDGIAAERAGMAFLVAGEAHAHPGGGFLRIWERILAQL